MRAIKSLVPRHGDERRSQTLHVQRQNPGGLGDIHDQRYTPVTAQLRYSLNGLDASEHVGYMIADHRVDARNDQSLKGRHRRLAVKGRRIRRGYIGSQRRQRPCHGVVLIAGDHHPPAAGNEALDGNIQPVRCVCSEYYPFRFLHVK